MKKTLQPQAEGSLFWWVPQTVRRHRTFVTLRSGGTLTSTPRGACSTRTGIGPARKTYTSIPIKPWLTAIAIACSLFFPPSLRSAQKSNVSISLSLS